MADNEKPKSNIPTPSQLKARATRAFTAHRGRNEDLQDIYELAIPGRNAWDTEETRMDRVFDSTAINSTARFANRLLADMTPPFQRWFEVKAGVGIKDDDDRITMNRGLRHVTDLVLATMGAGGYYTAAHENYQDLAAGQGFTIISKSMDGPPVLYNTINPSEFATEHDDDGREKAGFRRHKVNYADLKQRFEGAQFTEKLTQKITKAKESITDKKEDRAEVIQAFLWTGKKRIYDWHVLVDDEVVLSKQFTYKPYVSDRWSVLAGDTRGRGPLHLALPDIRTLNKVKELLLMSAALAIVGAYTVVDDGVVNVDTLSVVPGALMVVGSNGTQFNGPTIRPLETGRSFELTQLAINDLQLAIKKALLDDNLPPELGAVRSPTEIVHRAKELATDSGAAFSRLMDEWIKPTIQATIDILRDPAFNLLTNDDLGFDAGDLTLDDLAFKVTVLSPLARVQALVDIEGIIEFMQISNGLFGEEATVTTVKVEEILPWLAEAMGMMAKHIRNTDEREEFLEEMKQRAEEQLRQVAEQQAAQPASAPAPA